MTALLLDSAVKYFLDFLYRVIPIDVFKNTFYMDLRKTKARRVYGKTGRIR